MASVRTARSHPPRPLPVADTLCAEDYRRVIGVLENVDRADDLEVFETRLVDALHTWFDYSHAAVLHGGTVAGTVRDGKGVKSGYSPRFMAEYTDRWVNADPFRSDEAIRLFATRDVITLGDLTVPSAYTEVFLRRHGIGDKAGTVIDLGPSGVLFLGVVRRKAHHASARDVAVLRKLRRHLTPLAAGLLSRRTIERRWRLTPREREVAALAAQGLTNQQIAQRLFISPDTVKKHLTRVLAETSCTSRTQLALRWTDC